MALKIISNNDNVQEDKAIDYPCLMEFIGCGNDGNTCIVLEINEQAGIYIEDTCRPESEGKFEIDITPFTDKTMWKPYDKPVTFCNA